VKIAYTAAIGDTSANANDSATGTESRAAAGAGGRQGLFSSSCWAIVASHGVRH